MATNTKHEDLLLNLREKYIKVRDLLDTRDKNDLSGSEVALSRKNEAIEILKEMQIKLEDALNTDEKGDETLNYLLAVIWLDLGIVSIDNEELKVGEEYLMRCIDLLTGNELNPNGILPSLSALNQLGIVWFQWSNPNKAEFFLKQAEKIYKDYTSLKNDKPVAMTALFGIVDDKEPKPTEVLDKLYTLTLYYLAQIYGVIKDHAKSAEYCHMTLQRQLNHSDLDHIDWALNAATLAQFFMEKQDFRQARHHLAAASLILKRYEETLGKPPIKGESDDATQSSMKKESENVSGTTIKGERENAAEHSIKEEGDDVTDAKWERYRHRSADVARCWAKYGILLMSTSRERLLELADGSKTKNDSESSNRDEAESCDEKKVVFESMKFPSLEKDIEPIANRVTDKYLLVFNDAREVFLDVQDWLKEAQKYYNFESHASDYVQIIEDMSQSFKCLCFFEDCDERQAKMHKRRIDLLTPVVNELNPQYYQAECRQIWIELAETYSEILNIKLDKIRATDERPTPHALSKINSLAQMAISYYKKFLDSLKKTEDSPDVIKFSDEMVRPALYAYFHLGTLYNKIITPDKHAQLENIKNSIAAYKFFVNYCESNEELAKCMEQELTVCKDLVKLLPLKMNKLLQSISGN